MKNTFFHILFVYVSSYLIFINGQHSGGGGSVHHPSHISTGSGGKGECDITCILIISITAGVIGICGLLITIYKCRQESRMRQSLSDPTFISIPHPELSDIKEKKLSLFPEGRNEYIGTYTGNSDKNRGRHDWRCNLEFEKVDWNETNEDYWIEGDGKDAPGSFKIKGAFKLNGTFKMKKIYSSYVVVYDGRRELNAGYGFGGTWVLFDLNKSFLDTGTFRLYPINPYTFQSLSSLKIPNFIQFACNTNRMSTNIEHDICLSCYKQNCEVTIVGCGHTSKCIDCAINSKTSNIYCNVCNELPEGYLICNTQNLTQQQLDLIKIHNSNPKNYSHQFATSVDANKLIPALQQEGNVLDKDDISVIRYSEFMV